MSECCTCRLCQAIWGMAEQSSSAVVIGQFCTTDDVTVK